MSLLSRAERSRCDFAWSRLRRDHADGVHLVVEGFYGVEQYAPDYVRTLLPVLQERATREADILTWVDAEQHERAAANVFRRVERYAADTGVAHTMAADFIRARPPARAADRAIEADPTSKEAAFNRP